MATYPATAHCGPYGLRHSAIPLQGQNRSGQRSDRGRSTTLKRPAERREHLHAGRRVGPLGSTAVP